MKFYSKKLRKIRKDFKLSINELASLINKSPSAVSAWENGTRNPPEETVRMIARILQIQVAELSDLNELTETKESSIRLLHTSENTFLNDSISLEEALEKAQKYLKKIKNHNSSAIQAELILNAFLNSMPLMFYLKNKDLSYIQANKTFLNHLNLGEDDILQKKDCSILNLSEAEENNSEDLKVLQTGKPILLQEKILLASNRKKWALASKMPIRDPFGNIIGVIGTFIDITKRKNAEHTRLLLEKVINKLEENIWIATLGENSEYIFINDATDRIFGLPKSVFYDNLKTWIKIIYPEDKSRVIDWFKNSLYPKKTEYRIVKPDKSIRWISHTIHHLDIPDMYPIHFGIKQDITEQKKNEKMHSIFKTLCDLIQDCAIYVKPAEIKSNFDYISMSITELLKSENNSKIANFDDLVPYIADCDHKRLLSFFKDLSKNKVIELTLKDNRIIQLTSFRDISDKCFPFDYGLIKLMKKRNIENENSYC